MSVKQSAENAIFSYPKDTNNNPSMQGAADLFKNVRHTRATVALLVSDTSLSYTAGTADYVAEGDVIQAAEFTYEVAATGATDAHLETAGGVKLYVSGSVVAPEALETIESAVSVAAQSGRALVGSPGKTYTFNTGVTLTDVPLMAIFTGCNLVRAASGPADAQPAIRIDHTFDQTTYGAATSITALTYQLFDYGNGATTVPRIELADVSGYSVGDIVKVMSSDKIPSIAPWTEMRHAESGEIGAIDAANNYIYLLRPFYEVFTGGLKIARYKNLPVRLIGGDWVDGAGYPVTRDAPMLFGTGLVRPVFDGVRTADTASIGIRLLSPYEPVHRDCTHDRPRHDTTNNAFAYGVRFGGGATRPVSRSTQGTGCRHVVDTGGFTVSDASLDAANVYSLGGTMAMEVHDGVGFDSLNAPFTDHPDAFGSKFMNCSSQWTNRRSANATLWGLEMRGRQSRAVGGNYEGLNPIRLEPSTNDLMVLKNVSATKIAVNDSDAALEPMIDVKGAGVVSGKANVKMIGMDLVAEKGRKEIVRLSNAEVGFEGQIDYAASLSNAVYFNLEAASELTINGLVADASGSTDITPMITRLEDAASSVSAPGRVTIKDSTGVGSTIVLTDYNSLGGESRWYDVLVDNDLFGNDGWRNEGGAGHKQASVQRTDGAARPNVAEVSFSSGSGAKDVAWPTGRGEFEIYVAINVTASGTYLGAIPDGTFDGQRVLLSNVAASLSFDVDGTSTNVSVAGTRTVPPGGTLAMIWDGSNWIA